MSLCWKVSTLTICFSFICFIASFSVFLLKLYIFISVWRRWEDVIRMDLRETGLGGVDWIQLAQDRDRWRSVVSTVMNLRVIVPRS
jgi:hypothetical protein